MLWRWQDRCAARTSIWRRPWSWLGYLLLSDVAVEAMRRDQRLALRQDAVDMFYHGYDGYMAIAFPEDELRPVSCAPLTRDAEHPDNIGVNDVLGNYSLTLIDTLSTLAVIASSPSAQTRLPTALEEFENGVRLLVENYGDGSDGSPGYGTRARGFDVDSKVQVFETVIRGIGGLLSAHLFAVGDLPINGYDPRKDNGRRETHQHGLQSEAPIEWSNGFLYDGQLLRLALDLGKRLLPAFKTPSGVPYPRVNLRHGIPFYGDPPPRLEEAKCSDKIDEPEITETCSAGAGSLVLEFITLSRLTGDLRFEQVAKRAFWEVWERRSSVGLIGGGLDAETGLWTSATTGIGAGIDSFFEYALKSHILSSGLDPPSQLNHSASSQARSGSRLGSGTSDDSDVFLGAWQDAHAAIKRHLYRESHHPHYVNAHLSTGSTMAPWIDSLSAYYPGLLILAGELEEAVSTNLLYSALWTRYSALPERWSMLNGGIEGGLGWWPGRPELIESVYYLYRATKDPWYLHVGEMVLKDIKRRCWTKCGWAGLQDVRTGEKSDRMESFFLGETIKYLFLLFDIDHPLNTLDAPYVFSTEGHPLIVRQRHFQPRPGLSKPPATTQQTCPKAPEFQPLTMSSVVAREDFFHAASLTRLTSVTRQEATDEASGQQELSLEGTLPAHFAFYPWTLPASLVPLNGTSSKLRKTYSFEIQFPTTDSNVVVGQQNVVRLADGLLLRHLGGLKLGLVLEEPGSSATERASTLGGLYRVHSIGNFPLGRDEKILIKREAFEDLVDPNFSLVCDSVMADVIVGSAKGRRSPQWASSTLGIIAHEQEAREPKDPDLRDTPAAASLQLTSGGTTSTNPGHAVDVQFLTLKAICSSGIGACPLPDVEVAADSAMASRHGRTTLPWTTLYLAGENCDGKLPDTSATQHQVLVLRRGGCSFSRKLSRIPIFRPSDESLQLAIVVSASDDNIRPLLDEVQYTPAGLVRFHQIPMVMVGGGQTTYELLAQAKGVRLQKRYHVFSQGVLVHNVVVV